MIGTFCFSRDMYKVLDGHFDLPAPAQSVELATSDTCLVEPSVPSEPVVCVTPGYVHPDVDVSDEVLDLTDALLPPRREFDRMMGLNWERYNHRKGCIFNDSHGSRGRKPRKPWRDSREVRVVH